MRHRVLALVLALALGARDAAAQGVATADDARAWEANPALIGFRHPAGWQLQWNGRDGAFTDASAVATWRRFAFSVAGDRDSSQRAGFGFSLGSGPLRLGLGGEWTALRAPRDARAFDTRAGLSWRPLPSFAAGARVEHLSRSALAGVRPDRSYALGAALRPFAWSRERAHDLGPRFTLEAEVTLLEGASRRDAATIVGVALEPIDGLVLRAAAGSGGERRVALTLRGAHRAFTHERRGTRTLDGGESWTLSGQSARERALVALPGEARIARVTVRGPLADEDIPGGLMGGGGDVPSGPIHRQLEQALEDPLTRGVFLELGGASGMAQLEELRPRIQRLVVAGKPVVAYIEKSGGRGDLYLGSTATQVFASPAAEFVGMGLRVERRSYRAMLERAGIRMDRASIGVFKSAYRNYSVDSTPPADTLVIQRMLTQRQQLFVDAVTSGRRIPAERLMPVLDGRDHDARALARLGVIDSVGWREDALAALGRLTGLGRRPRRVDLRRDPPARERWATPTRIAIVYAGGAIVDGRSGADLLDGGVMGDRTVIAQLESAFRRRDVRAVVLRIESPGGSASASHLLDHTVQRLRAETRKPLVVSMGSVAASGGYFMSAHADRIWANRHTVTGSIGVVFVKPSFEGLYERLGVRQEDFDRGEFMRGLSPARAWRPQDQAAADSAVGRLYRTFTRSVAEGRDIQPGEAVAVAQGRAWMAEDAAERRLVDSIGGLESALAEARRLAQVPTREFIAPVEYRRPRGTLIERVVGGWLRERLGEGLRLRGLEGTQMRADEELLDLD